MTKGNLIEAELPVEEDLSPDAAVVADAGIEAETIKEPDLQLTIGRKIYGAAFDGKYHTVKDSIDLVDKFKAYYFERKRADINLGSSKIMADFNAEIAPLCFYPYPDTYKGWRKKWDKAILQEQGLAVEEEKRKEGVRNSINAVDMELTGSTDERLERKSNTLADLLLDDAMKMITSEEGEEEMFDEKTKIKRKSYALNVFKEITKKVQGKEALALKRSAESRENAGFLLNLLNRAQAGKLTEDQLKLIKGETADASA